LNENRSRVDARIDDEANAAASLLHGLDCHLNGSPALILLVLAYQDRRRDLKSGRFSCVVVYPATGSDANNAGSTAETMRKRRSKTA
jgi:hypothetical protein